jgi:glycosyltransferase involved in cell wall biosynthesis
MFEMSGSRRVIYVRQAPYPWDIRVEKFCVSMREQGWGVDILARRGVDQSAVAEVDGMMVHRVGPEAPRFVSLPIPASPLWQLALNARVRAFKPDLLIARDVPVALFTAKAATKVGIPWVLDMAEHYPAGMRSWKRYNSNPLLNFAVSALRVPDRIERESVLRADGILTVCEEQKERLISQYQVPASRIEVIFNTPSRTRFAGIPDRVRDLHNVRFGYHGMISQDRDLITLVRGFDIAATKHPTITLDIAGFGESESDLRTEIARLRNRDRITMSGSFTHEDIDRLYAGIDFGVCCCELSEFSENAIANKYFDYAACGRPFLFTAQRPMLRLMERMRCGISYRGGDPQAAANSMLQLVDADYIALAANGRRIVAEEFNWENDAARMLDFFDRTIQQCGESKK